MAPEVLFEIPYDSRCDIYSLGCLMYNIIFAKYVHYGNTIEELENKVKTEKILWHEDVKVSS